MRNLRQPRTPAAVQRSTPQTQSSTHTTQPSAAEVTRQVQTAPALGNTDLLGLQPSIGNQAVQRLIAGNIQRAVTPRTTPGERYTVQDGDRLWNIAARELGDGERWTQITFADGRRISEREAGRLQPGTVLVLPGARDQGGQGGRGRTYTLQPGDRLWNIAARELGDGERWTEITHPDGRRISERAAANLQPGTEVLLPGRSNTPAPRQNNTPAQPAPRPAPTPRTNQPTAPRTNTPTAPRSNTPAQTDERLGSLSEQYESGGRGPGTVSGGQGDAGGPSYGTYQMTSQVTLRNGTVRRGGRVAEFLRSEGRPWASEFGSATPGSSQFTQVWQAIARRQRQAFGDAQHAYIERTHYDPLAEKVEENQGIDLDQRTKTLRDVIWSTAVQHGPSNSIVDLALRGQNASTLSDEAIIRAIYRERGRKENGVLVHFSRNSRRVQAGVSARFVEEEARALNELRAELRNGRGNNTGAIPNAPRPQVPANNGPTPQRPASPQRPAESSTPANLQALLAQPRLTTAEIAQARALIAREPNAQARGDLYQLLQSKVEYHSQRDNQARDARGNRVETNSGNMCNLTSLAMCLSYLGVPNPNPEMQYEDALEQIRVRHRLPARTTAAGWGGVAQRVGVQTGMIGWSVTEGEQWYRRNVLTRLRQGEAVMMSITGHIVRLQDVTAQGLVVDDPYGRSTLGRGTSRGWERGGANGRDVASDVNGRDGAGNRGEDHAWSWAEVSRHSMLWIAWFKR